MTARRDKLGAMALRDPHVPTPPPGMHELPSEDGEPMETQRHADQMHLLIHSLQYAWRDRSDFFAGGNMFVYFSDLQTKGQHFRGPDAWVALGVDGTKERLSWVAWEEGGKLPDVVIELLSPSTEHIDRGEKMRIYERVWRTGHYVLYDPYTHVLEGYVLSAGRYQPITPDARGDLPVATVGFSLGVRSGVYSRGEEIPWLRWIDSEGRTLPWVPSEIEAQLAQKIDAETSRADAERARADAEKARADAAIARLAELESKLPR